MAPPSVRTLSGPARQLAILAIAVLFLDVLLSGVQGIVAPPPLSTARPPPPTVVAVTAAAALPPGASVQVTFKVSFTVVLSDVDVVMLLPPSNTSRRWQLQLFPWVSNTSQPNYSAPQDGSFVSYLYTVSSKLVQFVVPVGAYAVLVVDPDDDITNPTMFGEAATPLYAALQNITAPGKMVGVTVQLAPVGFVVRFGHVATLPGDQISAYADGVAVSAYTLPTGSTASQEVVLWDSGYTSSGGIIFAFSPGSVYRLTFTLPTLPTPTVVHTPYVMAPPNTFNTSGLTTVVVDASQTLFCGGGEVVSNQLTGNFPASLSLSGLVYTPYLSCVWVVVTGLPFIYVSLNYSALLPGDSLTIVLDSIYRQKLPPTGTLATDNGGIYADTFQAANLTIIFSAGTQAGSANGFSFHWQGVEGPSRFASQFLILIVACSTTAGVLLLLLIAWHCFVRPAMRRARAEATAQQAQLMNGGGALPPGAPAAARVKHHVSKRILRLLPVRPYELPVQTPSASSEGGVDVVDDPPDCCSICLGDFTVGEKVKLLPCRHFYHVPCIDQWLRRDVVCPLCKRNVLETVDMEELQRNAVPSAPTEPGASGAAERVDSVTDSPDHSRTPSAAVVVSPQMRALAAAAAVSAAATDGALTETVVVGGSPDVRGRGGAPSPRDSNVSLPAARLPSTSASGGSSSGGVSNFLRRVGDAMTGGTSSPLVAPAMRETRDPPAPIPARVSIPGGATAAPSPTSAPVSPAPVTAGALLSARLSLTDVEPSRDSFDSPGGSRVPSAIQRGSAARGGVMPPHSPETSRRSEGGGAGIWAAASPPASTSLEMSHLGSHQLGQAAHSADAVPGVGSPLPAEVTRLASQSGARPLSPASTASPRAGSTLGRQTSTRR